MVDTCTLEINKLLLLLLENPPAKELETIVVQRLSAEVSGKAQKNSRKGPRVFVPFQVYQELSINNIKLACMKQFDMFDTFCDVIAGEQGPSCSSIKQLHLQSHSHSLCTC